MTITIIDVRNCRYNAEDNSAIDCEAKFNGLPTKEYNNQWLPFGANPNDVEAHGREIFTNAKNGDYGEIAPFEHPSYEVEMGSLRSKRNMYLVQTDWTRSDDVSQAVKDKYTTYRQELRDLTEGIDTAAKARAVVYPNKP